MNRNHDRLCSSDRWARYIGDKVVDPIGARVRLGKRMLEIGPGPGAATARLRQLVPRLTVLEPDERAAAALTERFRGENVEVHRGDATTMEFSDAAFDSVGAFTMLHHVPSVRMQDQILFEVFRVLRPGGVFVGSDSLAATAVHDFHRGDVYNPVEPASFFTRLRTAGFDSISIDADDELVFVARKPKKGR